MRIGLEPKRERYTLMEKRSGRRFKGYHTSNLALSTHTQHDFVDDFEVRCFPKACNYKEDSSNRVSHTMPTRVVSVLYRRMVMVERIGLLRFRPIIL